MKIAAYDMFFNAKVQETFDIDAFMPADGLAFRADESAAGALFEDAALAAMLKPRMAATVGITLVLPYTVKLVLH
ncbi:MAG: hypothetical protein RQ715_09475 [Methylococcales bacterium]|nr:hypothetical protein [Methylococcales bacterium]